MTPALSVTHKLALEKEIGPGVIWQRRGSEVEGGGGGGDGPPSGWTCFPRESCSFSRPCLMLPPTPPHILVSLSVTLPSPSSFPSQNIVSNAPMKTCLTFTISSIRKDL